MSEPPITLLAGSFSNKFNGPITRIVIHDEEHNVGPNSAEEVARYFHNLPVNGDASCHYIVDSDSEQHCVPDDRVAYHAPPNTGSVGIEQDGYAHFTLNEWRQRDSWATVCRAAARTAELCKRFGLPAVWLSPDDLRSGAFGVTSHLDVSLAFGQSDHTDPGNQYPVDAFMDQVRYGLSALADVRSFQQASGLVVDGDPGIKTILRLGDFLYDAGYLPPPSFPRTNNRFAGYPIISNGARDPFLVGGYSPKAPVQALQNCLNILMQMESSKNPNHLVPDGVFGLGTNNVARVYQNRNHLTVDGIVGPQTWSLLDYQLALLGR